MLCLERMAIADNAFRARIRLKNAGKDIYWVSLTAVQQDVSSSCITVQHGL